MNPLISALIWVVLSGAGLAVMVLPRPFELLLGRWLGRLILLVPHGKRRIAWDNIRRCLPELGEAGWKTLLRENYEHYGVLGLELLHLFSPVPGHWRAYCRRWVRIENFEDWKKVHEKAGRSVVIVTHLANWEMMGSTAGHGLSITMAVRRLKPAWLNERVTAARQSVGGKVAYGKRILPLLLKALKDGEAIGLVFDQYVVPPMGLPATFFGVKTETQSVVSLLVQRTGTAVLPVTQRRDERGVVRVTFEPAIEFTPEELADPAKTAERISARVEAQIRANPAQWLWAHRRFKNVVWPDSVA